MSERPEVPRPSCVFSFQVVSQLQQPVVYVRRRILDGKAVYAGYSGQGISRAITKTHEKGTVSEGEVLELYFIDGEGLSDYEQGRMARALEDMLIHRDRPELNNPRRDGRLNCSVSDCPHCSPYGEIPTPKVNGVYLLSVELEKAMHEAQEDRDHRLQSLVATLAREVGLRVEDEG